MTPSASSSLAPIEATLLLDTNSSARQLGLRDRGSMDRRLLYTAPDAYVELRIPPTKVFDGESPWLYGQVVGTREGATRGRAATVTLTIDSGQEASTQVGSTGDFAMPCDPLRPFDLLYRRVGAAPILVRYVP